jgi:hypothetical protein
LYSTILSPLPTVRTNCDTETLFRHTLWATHTFVWAQRVPVRRAPVACGSPVWPADTAADNTTFDGHKQTDETTHRAENDNVERGSQRDARDEHGHTANGYIVIQATASLSRLLHFRDLRKRLSKATRRTARQSEPKQWL